MLYAYSYILIVTMGEWLPTREVMSQVNRTEKVTAIIQVPENTD